MVHHKREASARHHGVKVNIVLTCIILSFLFLFIDIALAPEQRLSISGLPSNNGIPPAGPSSRKDPMLASWPVVSANGNPPVLHLGKPLPGRDPKSRARSRDYLKQYVFLQLY